MLSTLQRKEANELFVRADNRAEAGAASENAVDLRAVESRFEVGSVVSA